MAFNTHGMVQDQGAVTGIHQSIVVSVELAKHESVDVAGVGKESFQCAQTQYPISTYWCVSLDAPLLRAVRAGETTRSMLRRTHRTRGLTRAFHSVNSTDMLLKAS